MEQSNAAHLTPLADLQRQRKESSRERLLAAAARTFCASGYFSVSVEDITSSAGVSRMTFYRHFGSKAAIAFELFRVNAEAAMPRVLSITQRDYRDRAIIADWIGRLFEADRTSGQLLRVFVQANVEDAEFSEGAQDYIGSVILALGRHIPAFDLAASAPHDRRRWLQAWLILYEIFDQGNHAARGAGIASDPLVIEILAERFQQFVTAPAAGMAADAGDHQHVVDPDWKAESE